MKITYHSIGTIYSPFEEKEGMPIQAIAANRIKGKIEINKNIRRRTF